MSGLAKVDSRLFGKELEENDDIFILPDEDNSSQIAIYKHSLVGRMFHQGGRSIHAMMALLPKPNIWNVEGGVWGISLGKSRFQFDFESERDLQKILSKRPRHFNQWSFSIERWEPYVSEAYPNTITLWIKTIGIPSMYWMEKTLKAFGDSLGVCRAEDAPLACI